MGAGDGTVTPEDFTWVETRFPGYFVCKEGHVLGPKGGILRPGRVGKTREYRQVTLGRKNQARVHRLVAETFLGPCPEGMHVAHLNGVAHDNRLENLAYKTPKENAADKKVHGTDRQGHVPGERNGRAILTWKKVREIRALPEGFNRTHAAREFGISRRSVLDVINGKTWREA